MINLPKRGRPKKQAPSSISIPVPQVEEFQAGSDDEQIPVGTFKQEDKILVGFSSKVNDNKREFEWTLDTGAQDKKSTLANYRELMESFMLKIDDYLSNSNSSSSYENYPERDIRSIVLMIANDNKSSCDKYHSEICLKLTNFAESIPLDMQNFNNAVEIGDYWNEMTGKVRMIAISWLPLCQNERNLHDFRDVFNVHLTLIFEENYRDLFYKLSQIIVEAYTESRESNDITPIKHSFEFVCHFKNELFDDVFMPMLIQSVMEYYEPILSKIFDDHPLSEYLQKSVEIKENEKKLIKSLLSKNALITLESKFNMLIFGNEQRFDTICKNLAPLIQQKDTKSVQTCADYARSTDKINLFARELSFEFESEAEKCFKTENPIKAIMKLHLSLAEFDKSFNNSHKRTLRSAFEKGFNTSPDTSARLLAEEVHREFIKKENDHKMCPKETIDQLVAVFRMIASKDVFEEAHHLLLTRRILMMKSHIVDADEYFKKELKEQCGPEYTKRFDALFKDLGVSLATLEKFKSKMNPPPFFKALVVSNESWKVYPQENPIEAPDQIKMLLNAFTDFYQKNSSENEKKKLQWDFNFTRVKLNSKNLGLIKSIRCSGTYATFLLMFNNNKVLGPEYFKKNGKFSNEQIENILKVLKSRKCNHFLLVMHNKIRINKDQFLPSDESSLTEVKNKNGNEESNSKFSRCICFDYKSGVLSIPFVFPSFPKTDSDQQKNAIQSNRGMQFDAAVMKIMKQERSMEKIALKNTVKDSLNFRLEDEFFEKRLANLSKTLYLKLDPSGRVHYLT